MESKFIHLHREGTSGSISPLRTVQTVKLSDDVLSVKMKDENDFELVHLTTPDEWKGFKALIDFWQNERLSTSEVENALRTHLGYAAYLSPKQRLTITKGVIALLVNNTVSGQTTKLSKDTSDILAYIVGIENNKYPDQQFRRTVNNAKKIIAEIITMCEDSQCSKIATHSYLFSMIQNLLPDALSSIKEKQHKINSLFSKWAVKPLQRLFQNEDQTFITHIVNTICRHFVPNFCLQP